MYRRARPLVIPSSIDERGSLMRHSIRYCVALAVLAAGCGNRHPKLLSVTPATICANDPATLTLTGTALDAAKVEIGSTGDMGGAPLVAATSVSGKGTTVMAMFAAGSLTPSDTPYDLVYTDKNGKRIVLPGAVTVVDGITISAVDPGAVYNGVDFPTSVYGTGMGAVQKIQISMAGGAAIDLTNVTAVDQNRADTVVPMGTPPGTYDVTVVDANGCTATLAGALQVVADITVSICGIDPGFGYTGVDTDVVITATADGKEGSATCGGKSALFTSTPRAWLDVGGTLHSLRNVAFVSGGSLTATVPKGLDVGGPYDVIVQNPDGSVGLLPAAFKVVDMPVPVVTAIDPPVVPSNAVTTLKLTGANFRDPVKVQVYSQSVMLTEVASPTLVSANEVDVAIDPTALGLGVGAYVVRVTDTDQGTYGDFTALAIISSSTNLSEWTDQKTTTLPMPTMRHGAAAGQVSTAAHYLYVIGGDSGGATPTPYDVTQVATLDKYGNIGGWFVASNKLPAARTMLAVIAVPAANGAGGWLYAAGGYDGTATVATVSRAEILLPSDAPAITTSTVSLGGTLTRGTWYYRVSAVLDATDPGNPNGETLPSEEVTAHAVDGSKVTLSWSAVPHAATYRVYRTAMVNGTSKDEVVLADALTDTTFVDDGSLTAGTARPLRQGEHGVWVDVGALNKPRRSFGLALAHDPNGAAYLYAVGGDKGTGYANAVADADIYNTYEHTPLTDDGRTLVGWTEDATNTFIARTRLAAPVGESATSPAVGANTAYVYAIGGLGTGGTLQDNYQSAQVTVGGTLATWSAVSAPAQTSTSILQGLSSLIASNQLFAIGGEGATGAVVKNATSNIYTTPPLFGNLNADPHLETDTTLSESVAALAGLVFSSAHLYLLGGTTDGTAALPRVWSLVY